MRKIERWIVRMVVALRALFNYQPSRPNTPEQLEERFVIFPYKEDGQWFFDDEELGVHQEPLLNGVPEILELLMSIRGIKKDVIRVTFSASSFRGYDLEMIWDRSDAGGNWYRSEDFDMEGWLCPVLFLYYSSAPRTLFFRVN